MPLNVQNTPSPNFSEEVIPVEFLVLHYTACTLEETLRIFSSRETGVCAHFVIDVDGSVHDLGDFWDGPIRRGAHAGVSHFELDGRKWEGFNRFSIGVELVNFNGNLFSYPAPQYDALISLLRHLGARFDALSDPARIVGHEQIAGFRGKSDPGARFDWNLFFSRSFPSYLQKWPERFSILSPELLARFESAHGKIEPDRLSAGDWPLLSSKLEQFVAQALAGKETSK